MSEKDGLNHLLQDPDKQVVEAKGLARLFRQMLAELGVNPMKWHQLMNAYLNDPRNRVPKDSRAKSSTRGNLNKELMKSRMTWKNFERGIRFLNPVEAEFSVKLKWRGGRTTVHRLKMLGEPRRLRDRGDALSNEEDDEEGSNQ